jgi:hypothetical protein
MSEKRNMSKILEDFLRFEEKYSAFELRIEGIPIWERVRKQVYSKITSNSGDSTERKDGLDRIKAAKGISLWIKNFVHKNPYFSGKHDYLFWGHQRRKLQDDGQWWDIYFDPIYEEIDLDHVHLEVAHWTDHLTPAKTRNLRYIDMPVYTGTIARELFASRYSIDPESVSTLRSLEGALKRKFDTPIELLTMVREKLVQRKVRKPLYRLLLNRIQPKIVVLTVSYHRETFIEVCKDMNIPVVELQHGIIRPHHLGYSYPNNRSKHTFPDYLLVFGDYWKNTVEFPIPPENIYSVGYPYLDMMNEQYSSCKSTDQVIFISQPHIADQLTQFAVKFEEISDFSSVYKLHPHEYENWEKRFPHLKRSPIQVVTHEPRLYRLLSESTVQVGVNSTVLYEGLKFNLETFIFDDVDNHTSNLGKTEYANYVTDIEDLQKSINSPESKKLSTEVFFRTDPIKNVRTALSRIMKQHERSPTSGIAQDNLN